MTFQDEQARLKKSARNSVIRLVVFMVIWTAIIFAIMFRELGDGAPDPVRLFAPLGVGAFGLGLMIRALLRRLRNADTP